MKKFSKGLFAFLAIAFVMGLSAMVVSAKEVSLSPENFPDENLRKELERYKVQETEKVWDEDDEEWYEKEVYEEKEVWDEEWEEWYTERIPVYKKDTNGNYIIETGTNYSNSVYPFDLTNVKDCKGLEFFDDIEYVDVSSDLDVNILPSGFASKIKEVNVVPSDSYTIDLSVFNNASLISLVRVSDISKVPDEYADKFKYVAFFNSENKQNIDFSSWDNLEKIYLGSLDTLKTLKLGKKVGSIWVNWNQDFEGREKINKIVFPKNYTKKSIHIYGGNVDKIDFNKCKNIKTFISTGCNVKSFTNIPKQLKKLSFPFGCKVNVNKFLGKGYKKTGKTKDVKYNAKKGTVDLSMGGYITFAKGSQKIKITAL